MQIFMIQEKLRQKGQILAVNWVFAAVDLKNCNFVLLIPIYLITWGMEQRTYLAMPLELALQGKETETEIANIEAV